VGKINEIVTLQTVGDTAVSLVDWNMCSINGNQDHDQFSGAIAPGQTRSFPNIGGSPVWNDNERNDSALYKAAGYLVSYWVDQ
jgi:hypothetical protein